MILRGNNEAWNRWRWLLGPLGLVSAYAIWLQLYRLLAVSIVTFVGRSDQGGFAEIHEIYSANEIPMMGLGALLFGVLYVSLYPLISSRPTDWMTPQRIERNLVPGFLQGSVLAFGVILAFIISGTYRYLGFYIQFEEAGLAALGIGVRLVALMGLVLAEEFLFRGRVFLPLAERLGPVPAALLSSLAWSGLKFIQFDVGMAQWITLFLVGLALSWRTWEVRDPLKGAGFWLGILIVFHVLLSLPILGGDFSGIVLVKYQPPEGIDPWNDGQWVHRFLTGGIGGPLSSFAFQILITVDALRGILRRKKTIHRGLASS